MKKRYIHKPFLSCTLVALLFAGMWPFAFASESPHDQPLTEAQDHFVDESGPDGSEAQALAAFRDYVGELYDRLAASELPLKRAIAATLELDGVNPSNGQLRHDGKALLTGAVAAAPDDVTVQWISANQGDFSAGTCAPSHPPEDEVRNLLQLESDNAASWMLSLSLAEARNDEDGVDSALLWMASSPRYDDHIGDIMVKTATILARSPPPVTPGSMESARESSPQVRSFGMAMSLMRLLYQNLIAACKPEQTQAGREWRRHAWCIEAGRVMAHTASTLIARKIGLAVLRNADALQAEDIVLQNEMDWLAHQYVMLAPDIETDPRAIEVLLADWRDANDETEVFRRAIRRAGRSPTPPDSWTMP